MSYEGSHVGANQNRSGALYTSFLHVCVSLTLSRTLVISPWLSFWLLLWRCCILCAQVLTQEINQRPRPEEVQINQADALGYLQSESSNSISSQP